MRQLSGSPQDVGTTDFDAVWSGIEQLETPVLDVCVDRFQTTPPSNPCAGDVVIDLTSTGSTEPFRVLVGLPFAELSTIPRDSAVHVQLVGPQFLEVTRSVDGVVLVATGVIEDARGLDSVHYGPITLRRDDGIFCVARPQDPCTRIFVADALRVETGTTSQRLAPGETAMLTTAAGRYRVTHRAIVRRTTEGVPCIGPNHSECADLQPDTFSFELVRLGD